MMEWTIKVYEDAVLVEDQATFGTDLQAATEWLQAAIKHWGDDARYVLTYGPSAP